MKLRKISELITERLLMVCGWSTSLIILLIIVFLFKEGAGLFNTPSVENGYVLAINSNNSVRQLSEADIKLIFDREVDNWSAFGGKDETITVFTLDDVDAMFSPEQFGADYDLLPYCIDSLVVATPGIIAFFPEAYLSPSFHGFTLDIGNISFADFFTGKEWFPTAQPAPLFGVLPLLMGTLWVSLAAILFALPFGLAVAIYMAELSNNKMRRVLKPIIELLAGIPSVVYGFFGLVVVVPMVQKVFGLPVGETALVGAIILAIMALPTIITVAEDALRTVPRTVREASLALGASHWQTIWRVVLPYAISGISAAVVLGIGRAVGETMAVLMVTGNSAIIPDSLLQPVRTIPATIAAELGEAPNGGAHYEALFMLGCILFVITLVISIVAELVSTKRK